MSADPIWKAFAESGDPLYYLLYKAVCMDTAADKKQSGTKTRIRVSRPRLSDDWCT